MNRRTLLRTSLAAAAAPLVSPARSATAFYRYDREVSVDKLRVWEKALSFRPDLRNLKARLLANENPYGPSPKARLAMMENVKTFMAIVII